jgi:SAM-dependent methyltransferase
MCADDDRTRAGLTWQQGVWDRIAPNYVLRVNPRHVPVIDHLLARACLRAGEHVLDLGTGTGAVALRAAPLVAPNGRVVAVDPSAEMLAAAREEAARGRGVAITFAQGSAEAIPADDASFDLVLASLSMMYVIDRGAAAREIARVLRPGGRFVASVWAGPEENDLVRLQQMAARFAPVPPVSGVGPGALADARPVLAQLGEVGIAAHVERETLGFDCADFAEAWQWTGQTSALLTPERLRAAQQAIFAAMWPQGDGPRHLRNVTQFIVGARR